MDEDDKKRKIIMAPKIKTADQIFFSKDHQMVRRAVAEFVKKEINPNVAQWEEDEIAPLKDILKKMGDHGFLGIRYDPKDGGQGLDCWYDLVSWRSWVTSRLSD